MHLHSLVLVEHQFRQHSETRSLHSSISGQISKIYLNYILSLRSLASSFQRVPIAHKKFQFRVFSFTAMGSCWSVPISDPTSSGSAPVSKVVLVDPRLSSSETLTVASPGQSPSHHTNKDHGTETEECESNPEERRTHLGMYKTELKDEATTSPVKTKTRKELRIGYSSGGSSSNLEDDDLAPTFRTRTNSCDHLVDLRNSIGVDRDICKGVVRIEVSIVLSVAASNMCLPYCFTKGANDFVYAL